VVKPRGGFVGREDVTLEPAVGIIHELAQLGADFSVGDSAGSSNAGKALRRLKAHRSAFDIPAASASLSSGRSCPDRHCTGRLSASGWTPVLSREKGG
jgi:hypothetical protein